MPDPGAYHDVHRRYRELAMRHHAGLGGDAEDFRRIEEAYRLGLAHPRVLVTGGTLEPAPGGHAFVGCEGSPPASIEVSGPTTAVTIVQGELPPELTLRAFQGGRLVLDATACRLSAGLWLELDGGVIELRGGRLAIERGRLTGIHVPPGKAFGPAFNVVFEAPRDARVEMLERCEGLRFTGAQA